jgi:DNA invertase Pin-like site-specific DNA recombinase
MTIRCALYLRVSTTDQDTAMQRQQLTEFALRRGWAIIEIYEDIGVSGAKDSRPQLNRLMADAYKRRFDVVAVWKFDRFARSVSHLLRALETFAALGIDFVSFSESVDTSTPYGKMTFTVLGAVAELERSLIAERTKAGVAAARRRGAKLGRPRVAVDADQVRALRAQGLSWGAISKQLGAARGTCQRAAIVA